MISDAGNLERKVAGKTDEELWRPEGSSDFGNEVATAQSVAAEVSAIAKLAWADALSADDFESASRIYAHKLLSFLYISEAELSRVKLALSKAIDLIANTRGPEIPGSEPESKVLAELRSALGKETSDSTVSEHTEID